MPLHKDRSFNILQYDKQSRLISGYSITQSMSGIVSYFLDDDCVIILKYKIILKSFSLQFIGQGMRKGQPSLKCFWNLGFQVGRLVDHSLTTRQCQRLETGPRSFLISGPPYLWLHISTRKTFIFNKLCR